MELHVQVVGGLVQQQNVRVAQRDAGEDDARLLAAAELADGLQVVVPAQPKPAQLLPHLLWLQPALRKHQASAGIMASTHLKTVRWRSENAV